MKAYLAVIFALCALTSSVSAAGTDASCTEVLKAIKDKLALFNFNGQYLEQGNNMTPEFKISFDKTGYLVAEAVYAGCKWIPQSRVDRLADAVYASSPPKCREVSGFFAYQGIIRV